jgi:poly(hydroxyalkanoate) granule-associated protein
MATRKKSAKKSDGLIAVTQNRLLGTVHQVWLAGLGAVSKAQHGAPKLLEDLVAEGARVHASASRATDAAVRGVVSSVQSAIMDRADDLREKATDAFEDLEKIFQTRVHRALKQLGVPSAEEIAGLSKRVEALNANIEKMARGRAGTAKSRGNAGRMRGSAGRTGAHSTSAS